MKDGSAEIFELDNARARLRSADIDPRNFLAVGPYLEAVRTQQGLSLPVVSERTHIKVSYLEAIEQMAIEDFPSKPFAIGFVKVYAEALGLAPGPIVDRFKEEAGFTAAKPMPETPSVEQDAALAAHEERPNLSLAAVLAIVAFMIWCFYGITHPGPDSIKTPLKFDGVPVAATPPAGQAALEPSAPDEPADFDPGVIPALPAIIEARILERSDPVYPPACESGAAPVETVDVIFTITPEGAVVSERIADSSNACFERAALNAVKRWRFTPRTVDGIARPAFEQKAKFGFKRPS